jgi:hypothetical protein
MKKAYELPHSGVFYMIPDPKRTGSYTIYSEIQEKGGEDVSHLFLFDKVKQILKTRFKVDLEGVDAYTGIPRGRVIEPNDLHGNWVVAYGNDFPLNKYRDLIISEFLLRDASDSGKVKWEIDPHEKMTPEERKIMEAELGIVFTSTGWRKTK